MQKEDERRGRREKVKVYSVLVLLLQTEANNEVVTHYLVKWCSLPYEDAAWELEEDVDKDSICRFNLLQIRPPDEELEVRGGGGGGGGGGDRIFCYLLPFLLGM